VTETTVAGVPQAANEAVTVGRAAPEERTERAHHQVLLVPGCFGFASFGELSYFNGVRERLAESFARRGVDVTVTEVKTLPTASIRVRAARVLEALVRIAESSSGPIHVIGHSTGGLDARLAIAPTASLPTSVKLENYERVRTLVSVCCPHFGTPIATFFSSTLGKPLLRLFARYWMWVLKRGRLPVAILLRIGYFIVRLRDPFKKHKSTFDELYEKFLNDLGDERRLELVQFLAAVSTDQSLVFQLTPAGCDLLNACTADPELVYGSVVARARKPTFRIWLRSMRELYSQVMYPIYAVLHFIASRSEGEPLALTPRQATGLLQRYQELPGMLESDGIVPTRSQIWGELIHATEADHLDVVGQFGRIDESSWAGDWIPSYTGFTRQHFAALWSDVADFVIERSARLETRAAAAKIPPPR
jgi:triacylglycerol lipase